MNEKKNKTYENTQEANAQIAVISDEEKKRKKDINDRMHKANEQIGGI